MSKEQINIRVTESRKDDWNDAVKLKGYDSLSQLIRSAVDDEVRHLEAQINLRVNPEKKQAWEHAAAISEHDSLSQLIRSAVDIEVQRVYHSSRRVSNQEIYETVDAVGNTLPVLQDEIEENRRLMRQVLEQADDERD